jgi:hypothetical protein
MSAIRMFLSTILLLLSLTLATPVPQSNDIYCGSDDYSAQAIADAANAACGYVSSGTTAGGSTYPHKYKDYERFSFNGVSGPYYEFPILMDGSIYNGGK